MNLQELKQKLGRQKTNIPGWRTNRKIIVIESDDWGSIRMPSKEVYGNLLKAGIRVDNCPYNRYDSLAGEEDLIALFDVLVKFRDKNGNHPVITANSVVANPDFEKIRNSDYREYYYEIFTDTLKRYPKHQNSFLLWQQGITQKIFHPQFHGREHLNVKRWMKGLKDGLKETHIAFENGLFGISTTITSEKRKSYLAALEFDDISELGWQKQMLNDGLDLFEQLFGYRSSSYIAPNYIWHSDLEPCLTTRGVKYLQGSGNQIEPSESGNFIKRHRLGSRNSFGQYYLFRNCEFEPSINKTKLGIESTLFEIGTAFFWKKPAIISSHRLNYIGSIDPSNRAKNLILLNSLLEAVTNRWPDIEFMTTDQLGGIIANE